MSSKHLPHLKQRFQKALSIGTLILSASFIVACSDDKDHDSSNDSASTDSTVTSPTFPSAGNEAGAFTINTSGGNGNSFGGGKGGKGNIIEIALFDGMKGRLEVLDNGIVDASFLATQITSGMNSTGDSGETISADTTVNVVSTEPAINILYTVTDDTRLYKSNADSIIAQADEIVSGLSIDAGVTLTLGLNSSSASIANLTFTDDFINNGTLTTLANGTTQGGLVLWAKNIMTAANSTITTAGTDATVIDGGNISLTADYTIDNMGTVISSGFTDSNASPVDGGNAGNISFNSNASLYNTGAITAMGGGSATGNNSGNGGSISLSTTYGSLNNAAAIISSGGNADITSGAGNDIDLIVNNIGNLNNSGNLTASGGTSTTDNGSKGGDITLWVKGGTLKTSGTISSTGGNAADAKTGGNGGVIQIQSDWGDFDSPPGNILISGNINTRGGSVSGDTIGAGTGGNGGGFQITGNNNIKRGAPQLIGLWGYTSITTSGGEGETGNKAGGVSVYALTMDALSLENNYALISSGDIIVETNVTAKGGNSTSTTVTNRLGGAGGYVNMYTTEATSDYNILGETATVINTGNIITSSGNNHERTGSTVNTANTGVVFMSSGGGVTNSGSITTNGGSDNGATTNPGNGNNGGRVTIKSFAGAINNSGAVSANGGDGKLTGGSGGIMSMIGTMVNNTANLSSNGGNADASVSGSTGGDANNISLVAKNTSGISNTATISYSGGTGVKAGMNGREIIYSAE